MDLDPAIQLTVPVPGSVLNRDKLADEGPAVFSDRPISNLIAEDNRKLQKKLTGSFKGYVVYSANNFLSSKTS